MKRVFPDGGWMPCAATVLVTLTLSGCNVAVDEGPGYRPLPPRPAPRVCTMEYMPVCASRHGERRTFPNACGADAAGFRIVGRGECRGGGGGDWGDRPDRPQACTREYRPVCARQGGSVRSFGNACMARAADYHVIGQGNCR
jgi:hypothetical protein